MKKFALIIFLMLFTLQGALPASADAVSLDDQKKGEQKKKDPPGPAKVREKKPEEKPKAKPKEEPKKGKKSDDPIYG